MLVVPDGSNLGASMHTLEKGEKGLDNKVKEEFTRQTNEIRSGTNSVVTPVRVSASEEVTRSTQFAEMSMEK